MNNYVIKLIVSAPEFSYKKHRSFASGASETLERGCPCCGY
jgi:hypothetical protein